MGSIRTGRILLTATIAIGVVASFILDWSRNHLLSPLWHPHAKFHGGLLLFMLAGVSATSLWLLWRDSKEPEVAIRAAVLLSLSFWTPLYYVASILPGSSPWAGAPESDPRLYGSLVTPNLEVAAIFVILNMVAFGMSLRRTA